MKVLFLDTETTGNDPKNDRLVEVCYKIRDQKDIFCELFKPPLDISVKAMSVTHITNKMVAGKNPFKGSVMEKDLIEILKDHALVAHNAPFDIAMLENEGVDVPHFIDTLRVARHLDKDAVIPEYNLQFLRYYLEIDIPEAKAHDAKSDVLVLEALFERLYQKAGSIDEMLEISKTPSLMRKFNFGKYRDSLVEDVCKKDRDYLSWLYEQKVQDPLVSEDDDWLYTLRHYLKK